MNCSRLINGRRRSTDMAVAPLLEFVGNNCVPIACVVEFGEGKRVVRFQFEPKEAFAFADALRKVSRQCLTNPKQGRLFTKRRSK